MKSFTLEKTIPVTIMMFDTLSMTLEPHNFDLSFTLITEAPSNSEKDLLDARKDQNISFSKVVTFTECFINCSVVHDKQSQDNVMAAFGELENNLIVIPELSEMSLIAALHCKFNAITSENSHIERMRLFDINQKLSYEYFMIDEEEYAELPSPDEWNGEYPYWPGCWWARPDANTMDRDATDEEEYAAWSKEKEEKNIDELFMQVFTEIEQKFNEIFEGTPKEGEVIPVDFESKAEWKPVLVD